MKRRMEITFETEELVSIKLRRSFTGFCSQCNAVVEMLTPEVIAALSDLSEREIFRLIESGEIYFIETDRVFVCPNSLPKAKEK